jgi:hypothetical protein
MNKIVRDDFPRERLPDEIKNGLPEESRIRLEILLDEQQQKTLKLADFAGAIRNVHGTEDEVVAHLRALRDDE